MLVGTRSAARALQKSREHLKCQTTAGCRRDTCGAPKRHAFSACPPNFGKASHIRYGADLSQARWARKPRSLGGPRSQEIDQRSRHRNGLARKAANTAFLMCRAPWKTAPILPQMTMLPKSPWCLLDRLPRVGASRSRSSPPERRSERAACGASAKEPVRIKYEGAKLGPIV